MTLASDITTFCPGATIDRYARRLASQSGQQSLFGGVPPSPAAKQQSLPTARGKPAPTPGKEWGEEEERLHPRGTGGKWAKGDRVQIHEPDNRYGSSHHGKHGTIVDQTRDDVGELHHVKFDDGGSDKFDAAELRKSDKPASAHESIPPGLDPVAYRKGQQAHGIGIRNPEASGMKADYPDLKPSHAEPPAPRPQSGLFGDEYRPPAKKAAPIEGYGKERQPMLLPTSGKAGQMNLIRDVGVPDDLLPAHLRGQGGKEVKTSTPSAPFGEEYRKPEDKSSSRTRRAANPEVQSGSEESKTPTEKGGQAMSGTRRQLEAAANEAGLDSFARQDLWTAAGMSPSGDAEDQAKDMAAINLVLDKHARNADSAKKAKKIAARKSIGSAQVAKSYETGTKTGMEAGKNLSGKQLDKAIEEAESRWSGLRFRDEGPNGKLDATEYSTEYHEARGHFDGLLAAKNSAATSQGKMKPNLKTDP
jgi:hypothetical protein